MRRTHRTNAIHESTRKQIWRIFAWHHHPFHSLSFAYCVANYIPATSTFIMTASTIANCCAHTFYFKLSHRFGSQPTGDFLFFCCFLFVSSFTSFGSGENVIIIWRVLFCSIWFRICHLLMAAWMRGCMVVLCAWRRPRREGLLIIIGLCNATEWVHVCNEWCDAHHSDVPAHCSLILHRNGILVMLCVMCVRLMWARISDESQPKHQQIRTQASFIYV